MSRLLGIAALYALMFLAWSAAGAFLLFAPVRAGNLIHDSFGLFPAVRKKDWGRQLLLRLTGAGLIAFAARFAFRIAGIFGDV